MITFSIMITIVFINAIVIVIVNSDNSINVYDVTITFDSLIMLIIIAEVNMSMHINSPICNAIFPSSKDKNHV